MTLSGRNAIVTGASRGIGAQIARDLAKEGANVLLTFTSQSSKSKVEELIAELKKTTPDAELGSVKADMASLDVAKTVLTAAKELFGSKIHILVNNAGVSINATLADTTLDLYDNTFNVNVRGVLLLTQAVVPLMPDHAGGRIVTVSSVSARMGFPTQTVYGASKAAVEGFSRVWASELKDRGITSNCINPGPVETDMYRSTTDEFQANVEKSTKVATTAQISGIILMLCSDQAQWITGDVISANNGLLMI
ncbi:uncharacterized protein L969DRAFT_54249 [Mixia osmundae IAM 14324]|uniref:Ketoreductase domain-containing protein n=1 Tax=Mixia osmundae (strain CBS 9802 / IAM 14324 / JCM 22182 / KY 12970) TaxID=764103 RepID=G7E244_MIXOS|nr:uncharacterized protein L969DRAFT_54249 [Mixia osmundae IAM 14324]KEI36776.1 hypothetical protein L969DRAFT_54249 [Mixia osmundae IAM 14324]GAA96904.1 hypothetical protein E5Q_03578 [Mixia osmundae IAM 14324]